MRHYQYVPNNLAAGVSLLLAVIFITACANNPPHPPTKISTTAAPTNTPTLIPPTSTATPSPAPSRTPTLQPPTSTPTPQPSPTRTRIPATPTPTSTTQPPPKPTLITKISASEGVEVYETTITIPTYPVKDYLVEQIDALYNIPVFYFNRAEYEAANPTPTPVDYTGVVLENPYLRLTFIPELGGRLYSAIVKPTNQEVFYHNPVIKASRYGILEPYEANWWLGSGGMEWAYPTQEHGYRFGVPWDYNIEQGSRSTTITLSDTAPNRVGLTVDVTLPTDSATFTTAPKLINNGPADAPVQLWINAVLALTSGSMSPKTQFILPTEVITVHSRGETGWTVPGEKEQSPWPKVGETDLQNYNQWANYLGFFVPNQVAPFMAAYNPVTDLGMVRIGPSTLPGSNKLFAFGTEFPDRSYTDNDSQYFEMWGGANAGFWPKDDIMVPVGQTLAWQETWWPIAQLGNITWVNDHIAISLNQDGDTYTLLALMAQPTQGKLQVLAGNTLLLTDSFSANPTIPAQWEFVAPDRPINILFTANNETILLEHQVK